MYKSSVLSIVLHEHTVRKLKERGIIPNKSGREIIPNGMPKKYLKHFIYGIFIGDGSIFKSKNQYRLSITCCNKKFLNKLNEYIKGHVGHSQTTYKVRTGKKANIKRLFKAWHGNDMPFVLQRKKRKFLDFMKEKVS